jgi:hypothetical protein
MKTCSDFRLTASGMKCNERGLFMICGKVFHSVINRTGRITLFAVAIYKQLPFLGVK